MAWQISDDPTWYEAVAGAFLRSDPVAHTVALAVLHGPTPPAAHGRPMVAVLEASGEVAGVAWRFPPYPIGVSDVGPEQAAELAELLVSERSDLADAPSVTGPASTSPVLAAALAERWDRRAELQLVETLYRLDGEHAIVPDPRPVTGAARPARGDDVDLLAPWFVAFAAEAGTTQHPDPRARVETAVSAGQLLVWDDGGVVCMVGHRQTGGGVARIAPVYTPPAARGRGYASAATEAAARALFAAGARIVTLYADDANPVSTGIYRRLGFVPYAAWTEVALRT